MITDEARRRNCYSNIVQKHNEPRPCTHQLNLIECAHPMMEQTSALAHTRQTQYVSKHLRLTCTGLHGYDVVNIKRLSEINNDFKEQSGQATSNSSKPPPSSYSSYFILYVRIRWHCGDVMEKGFFAFCTL
jgi:hypothetical protein